MTSHTCRCTTCRCEMPDDDDALPLCCKCKTEPSATLDRDSGDAAFEASRERGRPKVTVIFR